MRFLLLLLPLLFFSAEGFSQQDSSLCARFRTGVFAYRDKDSNAVLVNRTAHRQEERIKVSGVVTKFKIRWIGYCSYELNQVWSNSKYKRKNNGNTTVVMMTAVNKDRYDFSCSCKNQEDEQKNRGTMYKVE
jgi:hypothetical protein